MWKQHKCHTHTLTVSLKRSLLFSRMKLYCAFDVSEITERNWWQCYRKVLKLHLGSFFWFIPSLYPQCIRVYVQNDRNTNTFSLFTVERTNRVVSMCTSIGSLASHEKNISFFSLNPFCFTKMHFAHKEIHLMRHKNHNEKETDDSLFRYFFLFLQRD